MGPLPIASRASLIIVKIAPHTGAEHDVPYMCRNTPSTYALNTEIEHKATRQIRHVQQQHNLPRWLQYQGMPETG